MAGFKINPDDSITEFKGTSEQVEPDLTSACGRAVAQQQEDEQQPEEDTE